ncbi:MULTISPECIES: RluA family pseudouridine synthase [Sphingobacterium]|jgi:23S rRNA pseudouridine955/2504/2580 synthase|uniref:RluA family pseudouridine synthase n=2 Tax=Sphingobacterium TaxID=28453 RepID=A0ABW5YQZ6_9SPHI|nr:MULTISPECIES: RluA family pseudouridine synthase [Sphingobacterium]KKX51943.1 pseudouridylate synthase [Sphingobacterium sp. IITKGP-BTPF85]MCW2260361.1 23S rRNA pseudouridine955/2504/2580 synthase [Sphingobacterium kitahiroshimense]QQD13609.1 RluA family pseudouridine synthase [Sphingobacterium sp. UDSM-2020]TCR05434.1 23S rRNA pseudouridine955/2504/2580 synthase [Sphingobacterium sp. JUb78]
MRENETRLFKFPKFSDLIVFEDDNLIVINKPPFIASLDEREGGEINILRLAKKYYADAQICHRLDKETSGLLLIAKNPETYRSVSIEFERRRVNKVYHAIIAGTHTFTDLKVELPILNQGSKNVSIDRAKGKAATTIFNSIRYFNHYTLVECKPITGRMHQIRIHLATQKAAIVGDDMYHGKPVYLSQIKKRGFSLAKNEEELPIMKRFALHSRYVDFTIDGKKFEFEAPYPKDFATLLKQLEKFDS